MSVPAVAVALLRCLPGAGTSRSPRPTRPPASRHASNLPPPGTPRWETPTFGGIGPSCDSQPGGRWGAGPSVGRQQPRSHGKRGVELNWQPAPVSTGQWWQECQCWPHLVTSVRWTFQKQVSCEQRPSRQPGSEEPGDHTSASRWRWAPAHGACLPDAPGGPMAVVTRSGRWAKTAGAAVSTWVLQR